MNPDIKLLGFTDIMSDSEERTEETHEHSEPKNATQEQSSAEEKTPTASPDQGKTSRMATSNLSECDIV